MERVEVKLYIGALERLPEHLFTIPTPELEVAINSLLSLLIKLKIEKNVRSKTGGV